MVEKLLARVQALEILLLELRKELEELKLCDTPGCDNEAIRHLCDDCYSDL